MSNLKLSVTVLLLLTAWVLDAQEAPKQASGLTGQQAAADFDQFWREIGNHYAYLSEKHIRWAQARQIYRARAAEARTRRDLLHVLEQAIAELYDDHATLGADAPGSPRIVPSRTDLWASWHGDLAILDEVRPGSAAAAAGLQAGDRVLSVGGVPIANAVARELPRTLTTTDPLARNWALRRVLAGRGGQPRDISVNHADGCTASVHLADDRAAPATTVLDARRLIDGIGYIRFHNSLGNPELVAAFDSALAEMKDASALVLDLRDTPGGGDSAVAEPILGRFVDRTRGYQKFIVPVGSWRRMRSFIEKVRPRGAFTYRGKLVVLVDHWTASMGEGVAVGLAGMHRATVIGTPMAGLNGATYTRRVRFSGIPYNYPAERIYALDGTPRETFQPEILVPLAGATSPDPILDCALAVLHGAAQAACNTPERREF